MGNYITIDGGTTNTRISLVMENEVIKTIKIHVGAGSGKKEYLKSEIKNAVSELSVNVEKILASGMITSEMGLCSLPHIPAPAGICELHGGMHEVVLPEISDIPFVFIPGIKISDETLEHTDMMRGEETELIGLGENLHDNSLYILPGSHSKIIRTDSCGRVTDFKTTLTGEMIWALSQDTILKDAVNLSQSETSEEYLIKGYRYCTDCGLNAALFKTRILKNMFGRNEREIYGFFMGAVLQAEIDAIIKAKENKIIIAGKRQIKNTMVSLLGALCSKKIICISDKTAETAPTIGAVKIYEYKRREQNEFL